MKRMLRIGGFLAALSLVLQGLAGVALAKTLVLEESGVTGKVQLPEVQMFISRQNLNEEYELELKESFVPKIVESIEKKPF